MLPRPRAHAFKTRAWGGPDRPPPRARPARLPSLPLRRRKSSWAFLAPDRSSSHVIRVNCFSRTHLPPPPPGAPRAPGLPRSAGAARSRPERGSFGGRAPPPARPGCPDRRAPRDRGRVRGIFGARPPRYGAPSRCLTRADAARARPADPLGPVRRTPLPEPAPAPPRSRAGAPARMRGHRRRTSRARPTGRGRTFSSRSCGRSR